MANSPAFVALRLLILHLSKLVGWKARKEAKGEFRRWWVGEAPGDNNPIDGRAVLAETTSSVYAWQLLLSPRRVYMDREASDEVSREFPLPLD